ncbi:hypothetical protein MCERE155_00475 [Candidatus Nanopelagicaceae bacterium]
MSENVKDKQLIGAAGEHLVLSRLLAKGLLASQAPRGTRKADVLVNPLDGGRPVLIQVKTTAGSKTRVGWHMNVKHESIKDKDLFYCFVDLGESNPVVYVLPAAIVAKVIKTGHANWLKTPGLKGRQRNDSDMRMISNSPRTENKYAPQGWMDKYLEAWDLLN